VTLQVSGEEDLGLRWATIYVSDDGLELGGFGVRLCLASQIAEAHHGARRSAGRPVPGGSSACAYPLIHSIGAELSVCRTILRSQVIGLPFARRGQQAVLRFLVLVRIQDGECAASL
jgi:hypothetical protein